MGRKYSVEEIDQMRRSVEWSFGISGCPKASVIEDRLRTHMLNGTTPAELEKSARASFEASVKAHDELEKWYADNPGYFASVDRNPEGQDPKGLDAEHESAAPKADAHTPTGAKS